jgi:type IV pilus assembly protein PilW
MSTGMPKYRLHLPRRRGRRVIADLPGRPGRGFTLVEVLVAIVLGIVVTLGVLQVYMATSRSYQTQEATARMMENGRTAIELISRSLRMAGYWRCDGWQPANLSNHLPRNQRGLFGTDGASGAPDTLRTLHALDETQVSVMSSVELTRLEVPPVGSPTLVPQPITVSDGSNFSGNELVVANDCAKADVFQLTGVEGGTLSHGCMTCVETYGTDATLLEVQDTQYFIANGEGSQPALFRRIDSGAAEELLEGVEDLQVFFGEDTDGDGFANRYVTADVINAPCADGTNPGCWGRVATVRLTLLMRTLDDNVTLAPQSYLYNGATVTASDRRLRRVFTAVIALRNKRF